MSDELRAELASSLEGRYRLLEELSGGGMARVFLAREERLDRPVVIKVFPGEVGAGVSAERFEREIQLAAALQDPHIVTVLSAGETASGVPYYTMPFVEGESLRKRLEDTRLPLTEAVEVLRAVAVALEVAHAHGVIHRDIKPGNVLLTARSAVVTDFGIAKALSEAREAKADGALTTEGVSLGSPAYMSPEQASGDPVDQRADVYAWGVLAYELLAGIHPFADRTTSQQLMSAHIAESPKPLADVGSAVPGALVALVTRCLQKSPDDRPDGADELVAVLDALGSTHSEPRERPLVTGRRAAVAAAVVMIGVLAAGWITREQERRWAREEAAGEIQALLAARSFEEAFQVAQRALSLAPDDSLLLAEVDRSAPLTEVRSDPPGASVYRRVDPGTDDWELLGSTPVTVRAPRGLPRFRLEADGYRPYETGRLDVPIALMPTGTDPTVPELVHVPEGTYLMSHRITGLGHLTRQTVPAFRFGRHEVTNGQYEAFIDAGGYERRELWAEVIEGRDGVLSWDEARSRFVDGTGRPGPSTWELGGYPMGQADYPVAGVSWYEADAFARFHGMRLPTIYHWSWASSPQSGDVIIPVSNVESDSLAPVGAFDGMSLSGAFDVAGNVREWNANAMGSDRFIMGGSHQDISYMFHHSNHADPLDRSSANGFRVASYAAADATVELEASIDQRFRDFRAEEPASEEVFAVYRRMYDYDPRPLESDVEETVTTADWIRHRVTFSGPDGEERVPAYLFLPVEGAPPYQTILFFPGANSLTGIAPMPAAGYGQIATPFTRTGRALLHPIYDGIYERRDADRVGTWYPDPSNRYRDQIVAMGKEFRRAFDYIESRPQLLDASKVAYVGVSWGGYMSGIMMAVEPRLKAGVLDCPGLAFDTPQPEVDPFHFLPRVKIPVRMIDGRYDAIFPVETSQQPMFELLGSPVGQKEHVITEDAHCPSREAFLTGALGWLDTWLGPVD